jgi:hypothetical protein
MTSPYWKVMNDLSETITSFLIIRDILRDSNGDKQLVDAAVVLFEHYIDVHDRAFVKAWNEVVKEKDDCMPPWGHSDLEYLCKYSDKELDGMCDAAELEQTQKNYRAAIDEYNKLNVKYKELTACHIELQDLFYKVDGELDELKVKYDKVQEAYHTVVTNVLNSK